MKKGAVLFLSLLLAGISSASMQWNDDYFIASQFPFPRTVFQGKLIGGYKTDIVSSSRGISIWDGISHEYGGSASLGTSNERCGQMWGIEGVGLFLINYKEYTPTHTGLLKSSDGYENFQEVLVPNQPGRDAVARSLIDLGRQQLAVGERRVLLYCEYVNSGGGNIWISAQANDSDAGNAGTWSRLFAADATAVRHLHGGIYVQNKGLYLFTGDSGVNNSHCSILFCHKDEIADLIENPEKWYGDTRWCLGAGQRNGWPVNYSSDYVLLACTQQARTVDFLTADSSYAYYVPDAITSYNGNAIKKVDLNGVSSTHPGTIINLINSGFMGIGWYGCVSNTGLIYISSRSRWETMSWSFGCYGFTDIWCVDPVTDECKKVKQFEILDPKPQNSIELGPLSYLVEYNGVIMGLLQAQYYEPFLGDTSSTEMPFYGSCLTQTPVTVPVPLNTNGSFESGNTTGFSFNSNFNKLSYDHGINKIKTGDWIAGSFSGASARVSAITVAGGWDGSAWGILNLEPSSIQGVFCPDETLKTGTDRSAAAVGPESADVVGIATAEVIDALTHPQLGIEGNALRVVIKNSDLTNTSQLAFLCNLSSEGRAILANRPLTFACKVFIDDTSDNRSTVNPYLVVIAGQASAIKSRSKRMSLKLGKWQWISASVIAKGGNSFSFEVHPDGYAENDNDYILMYFTDFQIIPGAIRSDQIRWSMPDFQEGDGTEENPYQIWTPQQMNSIGLNPKCWTSHFKLMADLDMSAYSHEMYNIIGNESTPFKGTLNGNGHIIRNLCYEATLGMNCVGLFGCLENAKIMNIGLENVSISSYGGCNIGGLAGINLSGKLISCYVTGSISGSRNTGGLIGYCLSGSATACYTEVIVQGDTNTGGLVGENVSGLLNSCYAVGSVSGNNSVGGLIGSQMSGVPIVACFWDVNTSSMTNGVGNLVSDPSDIAGLNTEMMKQINTFSNVGWDFINETLNGTNDYWRLCSDGINYPRLFWESTDGDLVCPDGISLEDFVYLADNWLNSNCTWVNNYCGGADMDFSGTVSFNELIVFTSNWLMP